jgi:putative peptide zinc metalloprotease protein
MIRRRIALLLASAVAALGLIGPAPASAQTPQDTSAVAVNTKDGASIFRLAFDIRRVTGDVVNQTNAAIAYSSCKDCRTVAISVQILLVQGSPTTVTPQNYAVAVNDQCTLCDSLALAYQFAVGGGPDPVYLTGRGVRQLMAIKRELRRIPVDELSDTEITARVDALMDRVATVLDTELTTKPRRPQRRQNDRRRAPPGSATPPGTTAPTETTPADTATTDTVPPDVVAPTETTPADAPPADTAPAGTTPSDTSPAPADPGTGTAPADTTQSPPADTTSPPADASAGTTTTP